MNILRKLRSSMAANIIGVVVFSLVLFGVVVSILGFVSFTSAFENEYSTSTYHMADTATTLVNGDHLDDYLAGEMEEEYAISANYLDKYCHRMNVSLIYVICVDTDDYGRFVSVFNPVNNAVDDSEYTSWPLGYQRDTTNEEYREKYRAIYEKKVPYETVYRIRTVDGQKPHITTLVPLKNSSDEVAAILCMQRPISEMVDAIRPYLLTVSIAALMLAILSIVFISWFIRRQFVQPVRRISKEAVRFSATQSKGKPLGRISRYREIADLADSIDTMETEMVAYMDNLAAVTSEKERISSELSFARLIQANSVPNDFPAFPERTDFRVYASMTPAKEVGGDFYNFFMIDDDHLAFMIGDVSGKGIPAALFMMVTNIVLSNRTLMGGTPAEILAFVNDNICAHNKLDMFVTLWLGIIDLTTGKVLAANAGHEDPAICRKDGSFELAKTRHGLVAGAMPGIRYRDAEFYLAPGDKVFLYTDGVPEATDGENRMFTLDRMLVTLSTVKNGSPEEILEGVHQEVNAFVGEAPQFDDLTMLCLEYKGR
ncbi:MAG: SpoIIE family protein phosphatase [Lachnospiraceae bacterium]|nr:SpoIIE family protein phosphatase [Lachnospiraceae bacterium]